ncbi:unnamed protein product [Bursaphelenchus xylophilus]|uniref:(pine wood nematode) hypothetical protein n=1 Tax=Bursaphelenchus xylophilus TaxID=6326 RepID=A0A7I8XNX4_BURXY|nr:unnamed protein product [Bursaphelenchus xylophilus]CAG9088378.1 unnamed protein product [Bursaphelenchus xylophilus]
MRFRRRTLIQALLLLFLPSFCSSVAIDNDLIGEPDIECLDSQIRVWIKTRKPFAGRIYAMGKADDDGCFKDDFSKHKSKKPRFDLPLGKCGMKSLRSMDPRGMYYGITLVVSFHPLFITKVDQAFHVKCFFEEVNKGLTAELGVSMIATTEIDARHGIPGCSYSIHRSSIEELDEGQPAGAPIQFAKIGDKVLHQWHCDDSMYGVLVHNCYVTDGVNTKAEVIDSRGCPVDPILITGIRYSADLQRAYAESQVFKFADKPALWFFCQIRMCMKKDGRCDGVTPPPCSTKEDNDNVHLLSGKKSGNTDEKEEEEESNNSEDEETETTETEEEIGEEYDETTPPPTTRQRSPSTKRPKKQKTTTKKPTDRKKKQFDEKPRGLSPIAEPAPSPSLPSSEHPAVPYGGLPPSSPIVADSNDNAPTVFGPGFSPDKEAFGGQAKDSNRREAAHTDFETNDDLHPEDGKQYDHPTTASQGSVRLSSAQSKKGGFFGRFLDYVDYDSDVTIPPTLTDLLANLPDDINREGIQKMLKDSVTDRRALLSSMDDLMSKLRSEGLSDVRRSPTSRSKRRPGERIDRMEVSWDSHRMRDAPLPFESDEPMISGQLMIYDLDETPPLGATLREFGVEEEHVESTDGCAISRQGLLVLAMSMGSLISTLLFVLAVMCMKQRRICRKKANGSYE